MHRGSPWGTSGDPSIEEDGTTGDTVIWIANESAQSDVTFPAGNWTFTARRTDGSGSRTVDVSIGVWSGSAFTADGAVTTVTIPSDGEDGFWGTFNIAASGFTVPQGQWLALRIQNNHGDDEFQIDASGAGQTDRSRIYSPCSDPGYPGVAGVSALNVTKVAKGGAGPYYPGDIITYNITVCNTGNVTLTNVAVDDTILGITALGTLGPGNCTSVELNYTVKDADACLGWINNTVYVYNGATLYNETSENVTVNCPAVPGKVDLFFLIDGSRSISAINFTLQLQGIADPINNSSIVPQDGSVSICVIQFDSIVSLEVPLTKITSQTVADQLAADILNITQSNNNTNMSGAFDMATANFPCCPADRQVIDLSTDGVPNRPQGVGDIYAYTMNARNNSIAAGFDEVNTLGVGTGINETFPQSLAYPQPWEDVPGFYLYADNFSTFTEAMEVKIGQELQPHCISGYKVNQSSGLGLANWTINVKNSTDAIVATTTTDATGYWEVCGLAPGNYTVCEVLQPGWRIIDPASGCQNVSFRATNMTGLNFTNCECNGSISNFVWVDTNQNGIQDGGEQGIGQVTVNLYLHASPETLIGTMETDNNGHYIFENLCAGNYSLQFILPPGYAFTLQNQGSNTEDSDVDPSTGSTKVFTLGDGEIDPTIDAGLYQIAQEPVPALTPSSLIALVSLLATIAALSIRRKRR
jgi:hypothetical protein